MNNNLKKLKDRLIELEKEAQTELLKRFSMSMVVESCLSERKIKEYFEIRRKLLSDIPVPKSEA